MKKGWFLSWTWEVLFFYSKNRLSWVENFTFKCVYWKILHWQKKELALSQIS